MITKPKFDESVFVCPGAAIVGDVTLGKNVNVWYNAVLRGDDGAIKVGDNTNVQDCAVLHEETTVGSGCTIGHGAIVHGCTVGDNVLIGMGATVLNGAKIGNNCIIGAGAFGEAYPECIVGGESMTREEVQAHGLKYSLTHVDFMVGTADLSIVGTTHDGREIPVFINGNFAI